MILSAHKDARFMAFKVVLLLGISWPPLCLLYDLYRRLVCHPIWKFGVALYLST
jgi:hypothetical protein